MRRLLYVPLLNRRWQQAAAGILIPTLATIAGKQLPGTTTASAAMYYLVGVVLASMFARVRGGLIAALASFGGLNYFFTPPFGTLRVERPEDLVALFGFFLVAALIATLLAESLEQRSRAERREREALLLYQLSSGLLARNRLEQVLSRVPKDLLELFDLESCELVLAGGLVGTDPRTLYQAGMKSFRATRGTSIDLKTNNQSYGTLKLFPKPENKLSTTEVELARAFGTQVALAVEAARLDESSRMARGEAEVSRIRAALFSSVTHDLKTPLASVKAAATSLLERGVVFDEAHRRDLLQTIVEETDRLNRLISNILQLSRLRAGVLLPQKTAVPIEEVIGSVLARLGSLFEAKGVAVDVKVREDVPPVPMDVLQIDQVLSNILENAARYAPADSRVEISAGPWHSFVEVLVADRGEGIAKEEREKVFDEFFRSEGRDGGGSGLGLAIVRAIVAAHGGETWVQETPGGGATVAFKLPIMREAITS